jgi:hypothetical protein
MTLLDDLVPEPLQTWDSDLLARLRRESKGETLFFEFKSTFDCEDVEKTVCAYANRLGGFLLFGVTARAADNTIDAFPGLEAGTGWLRRVSDCVVGHVSPLPVWDTTQIASPDDATRFVVVTRVEPSSRTPHLLTRSGRIYLRSPAGSDPVKDKATLDALVARGAEGTGIAESRADSLHGLNPGAELRVAPDGVSHRIQIAAVPSPQYGDEAFLSLMSVSGRKGAGSVFQHPAVRGLVPRAHLEDHVSLAVGGQAAARFTDGSIFFSSLQRGSYLGVDPLVDLIRGVLGAAELQSPSVHQVFLDVRILSAQACPVDPSGLGTSCSSRPLGKDFWTWAIETGTSPDARERTALALGRRLWRAVGDDRGLEPG